VTCLGIIPNTFIICGEDGNYCSDYCWQMGVAMSSNVRFGNVEKGIRKVEVITALVNERERQEKLKLEGRFQFTCADSELSNSEKLIVLLREIGEVAHAVNISGDKRESLLQQQHLSLLRTELIQVAAVAVAWAESIEAE
jgi:hypothetical protein